MRLETALVILITFVIRAIIEGTIYTYILDMIYCAVIKNACKIK